MLNNLHINTPTRAQQADDAAQARAALAALRQILADQLPRGAACRPIVEEAINTAAAAGVVRLDQQDTLLTIIKNDPVGAAQFILALLAEQAAAAGEAEAEA